MNALAVFLVLAEYCSGTGDEPFLHGGEEGAGIVMKSEHLARL